MKQELKKEHFHLALLYDLQNSEATSGKIIARTEKTFLVCRGNLKPTAKTNFLQSSPGRDTE